MKTKTLFALVCMLSIWALLSLADPAANHVFGRPEGIGNSPGQLQLVQQTLGNGVQQVVVLDSAQKSMAVYHIEPTTGKIELKSVRRLAVDLSMEEFNTQDPLPSELRRLSTKP